MNWARSLWLFLCLVLVPAPSLAESPPLPVPGRFPSLPETHKAPGFWIAGHPCPDRVILGEAEIRAFNRELMEDLKALEDILNPAQCPSGAALRASLEETWGEELRKGLFTGDERPCDRSFLDALRHEMALERIPETLLPRYGLLTARADQRVLPTAMALYRTRDIQEIDQLQNSTLDLGTPILLLHEARNGAWVYGMTPTCGGWVPKETVALCSRQALEGFLRADPAALVLEARTDLYVDPERRQYRETLGMGVRLPLVRLEADVAVVTAPYRLPDGTLSLGPAYLRRGHITTGPLPYTPRHALEQAFELLHSPYGWGDAHGGLDCSRLIQRVFSTMGLLLPRNSFDQARVGRPLATFAEGTPGRTREALLESHGLGGISLVSVPGHVMLYLGSDGKRPYVLHALFGYREPSREGERLRLVNRVHVTDLSLGEGTARGPVRDRLRHLRLLGR